MKRHVLIAGIWGLFITNISLYCTEKKSVVLTGKEPTIQLSQEKPPKKVCRAKRLRDERKRKRAERKKEGSEYKTISHKSYEELKKEKIARMAAKDNEGALRYLEKMMPLCNDLAELKTIMLELADTLYTVGSYSKAADMYHEFIVLYPGSDEVEYATYRAIVSNFKLTLDAEHDQSKTLATRELALSFLERQELFTKHKAEVEDILRQCEDRLLHSEENIVHFYLKRGNIKSAQHRLNNIKKDFLDKNIPDVNLRIAHLETELGIQQIANEQLQLTPGTVVVAQAEETNKTTEKHKSFTDRF